MSKEFTERRLDESMGGYFYALRHFLAYSGDIGLIKAIDSLKHYLVYTKDNSQLRKSLQEALDKIVQENKETLALYLIDKDPDTRHTTERVLNIKGR